MFTIPKKIKINLIALTLMVLVLPISINAALNQVRNRSRANVLTPPTPPNPPEPTASPHSLLLEFGFNTHVSCCGWNLNLETFKKNIDDLASNRQSWVRFNIIAEEIAPSGTPTTINWDRNNITTYDQAIDYSKEKGIKIFLTTSIPEYAKDYSLNDYQTVTQNYLGFLANRYKGKISIWQIFNEADVHNFRDYSYLPNLTDAYLRDLYQIIATARNTIKQIDPRITITANTSGYPLSDEVQQRWFRFFDALNQNLDLLSLDLYPDVNNIDKELMTMGVRVSNVQKRYRKPVSVAETGMCTRSSYFSEEDQNHYLPLYIHYLKSASPTPIIIYEIQDENNIPNDCEGSFGVKRYDGSEKPAYANVMTPPTSSAAPSLPPLNMQR